MKAGGGGWPARSSSTTRRAYPAEIPPGWCLPRASTAPVSMNSATSTSMSGRRSPDSTPRRSTDRMTSRRGSTTVSVYLAMSRGNFAPSPEQQGELPGPARVGVVGGHGLHQRDQVAADRLAARLRQRGLQCGQRVEEQVLLAWPAAVQMVALPTQGLGRHLLDAQALHAVLREHAERGVDDRAVGLLAARAARAARPGRGGARGAVRPGPRGVCSTTVLASAAAMVLAFHPGLGGDSRRDLSSSRGLGPYRGLSRPGLSRLSPGRGSLSRRAAWHPDQHDQRADQGDHRGNGRGDMHRVHEGGVTELVEAQSRVTQRRPRCRWP